jgi:hypothetical protein
MPYSHQIGAFPHGNALVLLIGSGFFQTGKHEVVAVDKEVNEK